VDAGQRLAHLNDLVDYKREALKQLLIVSTIFGAFSVSGVVALLTGELRGRLRTFLFVALCIASLAFIFGTSLDAIMLPAMLRPASTRNADQAAGLLELGDAVFFAVMIGALALIVAIGGFGFAFSKRIGWTIVCAAAATLVLFVWSAIYLIGLYTR
jgi:hypothetical protein